MAIKVKHDMNAAPAAAAGLASGRAKRSVEAAKMFAGGTGSGSRGGGTTGAQAHPVAPMGAHAQLTHASAPAVQAHAPAYHETMDDKLRLLDEQSRAALERQQLGEDAAQKRLDQTQEFTAGQNAAERDWRAQQEEARRKAQQDEWDRQHNILRTEHDADLVAAGTHEWGYTPQAEQQIKEMRDDLTKKISDDTLDEADILLAQEEFEKKVAAIPKTAVRRRDPQALFSQNTYKDEGGRVFTTDGKLVYDPGTATTREREYQMKMQDLEDKRYADVVLKLQQGYRATEPIYKMDEVGEKPVLDDGGKPIVDKYASVNKQFTEEQMQAILRQLFPNRFAPIPQAPVAQPPVVQPQAQAAQSQQPTEQQPTAQQPQPQGASDWRKKLGW